MTGFCGRETYSLLLVALVSVHQSSPVIVNGPATTTNKERLLYELRKYTSDSTHRYVLHVRLRVVMLNSMRNQLTLGQAEASMAFFLLRLHLAVFNKGHTIVFALSRGAAKNLQYCGTKPGLAPCLIRGLAPKPNFWRSLRLAKDAGRARRNWRLGWGSPFRIWTRFLRKYVYSRVV